MKKEQLLGYGSIAMAAVVFGTQGILSRYLLDFEIDPLGLAYLKSLCGVMILVGFVIAVPSAGFRIRREDIKLFILYGVVGTGLFSFLFFATIEATSVMTAVTLMYTAPAFTVVLAVLFLKERRSLLKALAVGMTLLGTGFVVVGYNMSQLSVQPRGLVLGVLMGLSYGIYNVLSKTLVERYSAWTVNFYSVLVASLFLGLIRNPVQLFSTVVIPVQVWFYVFLLAFLTNAVAYTLLIFGFRHVQASTGSIVANLEPLSSVLLAWLILGETMGMVQWIGFFLIVTSIFVVSREEGGEDVLQHNVGHQVLSEEE